MRLYLFVLFLIFSGGLVAQNINGTLTHDGEERTYTLYLPDAYTPGASLPLVINLHGFGSNSGEQRLYTSMNLTADTAGFIVVYPQGLARQTVFGSFGESWNAGFGTDVDDVGFLSQLIDRLWTDYDIDLSRVYATGMSNGGYMSYELACSLSDRVAAVASVTGSMTLTTFDACAPERPVPVLQFHGTADFVVAYNGIPLFSKPIEEVVDYWVGVNGCPTPADTVAIADIAPNDGSTVTHLVYDSCQAQTDVEFYKIANGGHTWPGAFPLPAAGSTNQDIRATPLIWQFFSRYTHPDPRPGTTLVSTAAGPAAAEFSVGPNPVVDRLSLRLPATHGQLLLTTAAGQLVRHQRITTQQLRLPVGDLPAGLYYLTYQHETGRRYTQRFIKQ